MKFYNFFIPRLHSSLVRLIPKYFTVLLAMLVSLVKTLFSYLLLMYRNTTGFHILNCLILLFIIIIILYTIFYNKSLLIC